MLLAEGQMTKRAVAADVGVSEQAIQNWFDDPLFVALVDKRTEEVRKRILSTGIADRIQRIRKLARLTERIEEAMEGDDIVLMVDKGVSKEYRETLKQVAQELGQWTEKRELSGSLEITNTDTTPAALITARIDELAAKRDERRMIDTEATG